MERLRSKEISRLEDIKVGARTKMDREQRAKQFMPFAALKGYEKALRQKEERITSREELSEEYKERTEEIPFEAIDVWTKENK